MSVYINFTLFIYIVNFFTPPPLLHPEPLTVWLNIIIFISLLQLYISDLLPAMSIHAGGAIGTLPTGHPGLAEGGLVVRNLKQVQNLIIRKSENKLGAELCRAQVSFVN